MRKRLLRPRLAIGVLVAVCAGVAFFSLTRTPSGEDATGGALATSSAAGIDPTAMRTLAPKDDVPSIDSPRFQAASRAGWLAAREPVVAIELGGEARAYPLQILIWHAIVNDSIGDQDFVVTFCTPCNTSLAFRRPVVDGTVTTFGSSGRVYNSNILLYDRATDSMWQQISGEAVSGELQGSKLFRIPAPIVAFGDFLAAFPKGRVLSRDTGFDRPYGENPNPGYDTSSEPPASFEGVVDDRLPAMERVLGVEEGADRIAFPFSRLSDDARGGLSAANTTVGSEPMVVFWRSGAASAQDARLIARSRVVGAALAFSRSLEGRELRFAVRGGRIVDEQTGSRWSIFGRAVSGSLIGNSLTPVHSLDSFWFEWAAFNPDTRVMD